jgi:hypothetical protein
MSTASPSTILAPTAETQLTAAFRDLEEIIVAQDEGYARLGGLVAARREAIRVADMAALSAALDGERRAIAALAELDRRRSEAVAVIARRFGMPADAVNVSAIAAKAPSRIGERLLAAAERLRLRIAAVRGESALVRTAAESLAQHVAGLLQTVAAAFASAKTYGRAGRLATTTPLRSIDLQS